MHLTAAKRTIRLGTAKFLGAFTVVELILTITIIAIFLTISVVSFKGSQVNSRDAERKTDTQTIASNLESFYTSGSDALTICPSGFLYVPGSATYGANSGNDFCVMKYEAKKSSSGSAVSTPNGAPWTDETQISGNGANVAAGALATDVALTDSNTSSSAYYSPSSTGLQAVRVDLGSVYNVETVQVWHYYADGRTYNSTKTEVSADGANWTTVFDSSTSGTYAETSGGHVITFGSKPVRYIRDWLNGSSVNVYDHWVEIKAFGGVLNDATDLAKTACTSYCHLMTEAEWMTVAQNVAGVASNWTGGAVGSNNLYTGHSDGSPAATLAADSNDSNGYYGTGNSAGSTQRRTLYLSNGEVIWDFAGNAYEWTTGQTAGAQPGASGYAWRDWSAITGSFAVNAYPSSTGIAGSSSWTVAANSMGAIYSSTTETVTHGILRGGSYSSGYLNAGVFSLSLQYTPVTHGVEFGFRSAYYNSTKTLTNQKTGRYPSTKVIGKETTYMSDLDKNSLTSPTTAEGTSSLVAATNNTQTTGGVSPQPTTSQYVYQPLKADGNLCTSELQTCTKFNIYYRLESDNTVYKITSKNQ